MDEANVGVTPERRPLRGALKVEVSTAEPIVTAEGDFSIFVVIRNPYNVPITVYSVQTHIPNELVDLVWLQRFRQAQKRARDDLLKKATGTRRIAVRLSGWWEILTAQLQAPKSPRTAQAVGTEEELFIPTDSPGETQITVGQNHGIVMGGAFSELWQLQFPENPSNEDLDRIFMKIEAVRTGTIPIVLQPGNSIVRQFMLRAKSRTFFSPIAYTFQIQISYAVDDETNLDTVSYSLEIRAGIRPTLIGAVIGSICGAIAKMLANLGGSGIISESQVALTTTNFIQAMSVITLAAILGAFAVVAFARKSNAQQIVSVEDFWGGLLIGFLVGYVGESYFRGLLGLK